MGERRELVHPPRLVPNAWELGTTEVVLLGPETSLGEFQSPRVRQSRRPQQNLAELPWVRRHQRLG